MRIKRVLFATLGMTIAAAILTGAIFSHAPIGGKYTLDYLGHISHDASAAVFDPSVPKVVNLGPETCAGYAVRAAGQMYGVDYNIRVNGDHSAEAGAWDLSSLNQSVWKGDAGSLDELLTALSSSGGELLPGDLLGIYSPISKHNMPGRDYTHVVVYSGGRMVAQEDVTFLWSNLDDYLAYSTERAKDLGIGGSYRIREVIRAPSNADNDVMLAPFILPGFYRSVAEPEK